jgi:S1-C subfamily serine protease
MTKGVLFSLLLVFLCSGWAVAANIKPDEFVSVQIAEKVLPSICAVESLQVINTQLIMFGMGGRQQSILKEIGTGVIVDKNGYIICKNWLVDDVQLVRVTLNDGSQADGEVIANDRDYDVALIKINPKGLNLVPVKVGNPGSIVPGDSAVCIGNSAGFKGTATYGIVSARRDYRTPNLVLVPLMIQADCAINSGNAGGPLFNWKGEMIGLHSNPGGVSGDVANINFFLPSDLVMRLTAEMIRTKKRAARPYLGILPYGQNSQGLADDLRMYYDLPEEYWEVGVLIQAVDQDGPAAEFGLLRGDLVVEVVVFGDSILAESIGELEKMLQTWRVDQVVIFKVLRHEQVVSIPVEIGAAPDEVMEFYF